MDNMPDEAIAELNGKLTKMLGSCIAQFVLGSRSFGETGEEIIHVVEYV
jgi:hypothetical protein